MKVSYRSWAGKSLARILVGAMANPSEVRIEDLDVSVRTWGFLEELGIETVADLLAMPIIEGHPLVMRELKELLDDNGFIYQGKWATPAKKQLLEATGSVTERWATIEAWLSDHATAALASFRPPATAIAIAAAEAELGLRLPEEYKELLAIHDGQKDMGPMVGFCSLLPVAELAPTRKSLIELFSKGTFDFDETDAGIAHVAWHNGWIPIGNFNRSYLALDLAPAPSGKLGQIFDSAVDDHSRTLVASGIADLLSRFFRELQDGTIDLDD